MIRAFLALELGTEAVAAVLELQRRLASGTPRGTLRWTPPEQLHLTLQFLGNVPPERLGELEHTLRAALDGAAALRLRLEAVGAFPSWRSPRVIWVGLGGELPRLAEVQRRAAAASAGFGDHLEARAFQPHLTVGRVNRPDCRTLRGLRELAASRTPLPPSDWRAAAVRLFESRLLPTGAVHSELARFDLV